MISWQENNKNDVTAEPEINTNSKHAKKYTNKDFNIRKRKLDNNIGYGTQIPTKNENIQLIIIVTITQKIYTCTKKCITYL